MDVDLLASSVLLPEDTFLFGHRYDWIHPTLRTQDELRGLSIGALLHRTPPRWVRLPAFRIARRMVTNGEYLAFVQDPLYEHATLWRNAWDALRLNEVPRTVPTRSGRSLEYLESFSQVSNAVEAYVESLEREAEALTADEQAADGGGARLGGGHLGKVAVRDGQATVSELRVGNLKLSIVFDYLREQLEVVTARSSGTEPPHAELETVLANLEEHQSFHVERHLKGAATQLPLEALLLLRRLRTAMSRGGPLRLADLLYPRTWRSAGGETEADPFSMGVPWVDQPVAGITIHEAIAFCVWLQYKAGGALRVDLPTEAQYERAAGWSEGDEVWAHRKQLYPWGDDGPGFFELFKGGDVFDPGSHEHLRRKEVFSRTVKRSARPVGDDRIEMLLGFGWQWTRDRYEPEVEDLLEPCYETARRPIDDSPVANYRGSDRQDRALIAVRGAPPFLGGTGLTTRRFAFPALRACSSLGFRWVAWDPDA